MEENGHILHIFARGVSIHNRGAGALLLLVGGTHTSFYKLQGICFV